MLREALVTPEQVEALARFATDLAHIALHSALVAIDGGSASAEVGVLQLLDGDGRSLGDDLHSDYVGHLLDTGRAT